MSEADRWRFVSAALCSLEIILAGLLWTSTTRLHATERRVLHALDGCPLTREGEAHLNGAPMRLILCTAVAALLAGAAVAQVPLPGAKVAKTSSTTTAATTAATTPKAAPPAKAAQQPRTAASLQCSKDADAKNLHGKPRKAFMSSCKKAAKG